MGGNNGKLLTQEQERELLRALLLGADTYSGKPHDSVLSGIGSVLESGISILGGLFGGVTAGATAVGALSADGVDEILKKISPDMKTVVVTYAATIDKDEPGYWEGRFTFIAQGKKVHEITIDTLDAEGNPLLDGTLFFHGKNLPVKNGKSSIRLSELVGILKSKENMQRIHYTTAGGLEIPGNVHVDFE
ncbi:MAG: hypothetical protein K5787_19035 [Lentisphaeria bacterium]|nr:hypothetical protein [Lentisphaeria bacterium]